jgi:hypothetical protein
MIRVSKLLSVVMAVVFFISGCSTLSTISSTQPDISIRIMEKPYAPTPVKEELSVRTFGSYYFVAEKKNADSLYGIIPLYVKVGNIILDALFFAPLVLFNARGAYPFYEIDFEKAIIRYSDDGQNWYDYKIIPEESNDSKIYYEGLNKKSP